MVCPCVGLFDFWLILWCVHVVLVVVVSGTGLRWWCLVMLSYCDVGGGGAGSVWLAVGVISCRDYGLKGEKVREKREHERREQILK